MNLSGGVRRRTSRVQRVLPVSKKSVRFTKSVAKIARKVVKNAGEKKFYDLDVAHNASNTGSVFGLLSNIVEGTSQNERIGDNIKLRSMYMQSTVLMNGTAGETKYRCLIVRQKGTAGGAPPTAADILKNHSSTYRVNSAVDTDKFTIVYDKVFPLHTYNKYRKVEFKLKFNSKTIQYNDTSVYPNREYWMLSISDAGTFTPYIVGNLRIKYTDV